MSRATHKRGKNTPRKGIWTPEVRRWLRGALLNNLALKIVSLILAIGLFVVINTSEERVINVWHDVNYTQPDDRVLMSEPVAKVRLTIQGSWRRIRRFDERELAPIKVDLANLQGSEYTFSQEDIHLPKGLQLLAVDPPSIRLDYEPKVSKVLTVIATPTGQLRPGYTLSGIEVEPEQIEVKGARSEMAKLESMVAVEANVTGRKESFELAGVPLHLPPSVLESSQRTVHVRVSVDPIIVERTLEAVPVAIKPTDEAALLQAGERFQTEPEHVRVTLTGPQNSVQPLVSGNGLDVYVEVSPPDLEDKGKRKLEVRVGNAPADTRVEIKPRSVRLVPRTPRTPGQP